MAAVAQIRLNGHPTYAIISKRQGPALLFLHGGMSSCASMLRSIGPYLRPYYNISAFDRRGHGRTADTEDEFHYDSMADETIAFIERLGKRVHVVGHSDGAIVALFVALRRPDLLRRVVAVGGNFHFDGLVTMEPFDLDGPGFDVWAQKYATHSPDGLAHARTVVEKTLRLFATEPTLTADDLARITLPVLVMAGDDEVISLAHTCALYEALPNSQLAIVPGTSHALLKERPKECAGLIRRYLRSKLPPVTYQPVRRAAAHQPGNDGAPN